MKGSLTTYLFQFLSGLVIFLIIIYAFYMITFIIFKKDYLNSKLSSEILSSIISSISSSSFNISFKMPAPLEYNISVKADVINVTIGQDQYSSRMVLPYYIDLKETSFTSGGEITINKTNDEVEIS